MPRIFPFGDNIDEWYKNAGGDGTSTHDVCHRCAQRLRKDPHIFDDELELYNEGLDAPDGGWDVGAAHPPYDDDPEMYTCTICEEQLVDWRDGGY